MADIYREDIVPIDLVDPVRRDSVGRTLATGDRLANRIGVTVRRRRVDVDLSGHVVTGYFIRPDMNTVVIPGTAAGSTAYVDIPQACLTERGKFSLAIKVSGADVTQTVRVIDGSIILTQTDDLVDPGNAVPSLDELLAKIAEMEAATEEARAAVAGAMINRKTIAAGTDFNTLKTDGVYYYAYTATPAPNAPDGGLGMLTVALQAGGAVLQDYVNLLDGKRFARYYSPASGEWKPWQNNVDDTLSISGAAADASAVAQKMQEMGLQIGVEINSVKNGLANLETFALISKGELDADADLNAFTTNGVYYYPYTDSKAKNAPDGGVGVLMVVMNGSLATTQNWVNSMTGSRYVRYRQDGIWMPWTNDVDGTLSVSGHAADAAAVGEQFSLQADALGLEVVNRFDKAAVTTGGFFNSYGIWNDNDLYYESDYIVVKPGDVIRAKYISTWAVCYFDQNKNYVSGAADAVTSRTVPDGVSYFRIAGEERTRSTQMVTINRALPSAYVEYGMTSTRVAALEAVTQDTAIKNTYRRPAKYLAFGDSLTVGQMWNDVDGTLQITIADAGDKMPARIAAATGFYNSFEVFAKGGVGLLDYLGADDTPTYAKDLVEQASYSGSFLATLAFGRNDSAHPLGTANSTAGEETIAGKMLELINYIRAQNPQIQIVVIAPLPSTRDYPFTTRYAGGWTLEEFNNVIGALCKKNKAGFVDWSECSLTASWGTYCAGASGNYAHPKYTYIYRALGMYAGGRVAHYCKAF